MFHVELRQFPHVARVFNLEREELDQRFARPWASGGIVDQEDRRWSPDRARLTIFEAPELPLDEIGMGRGWATVGKTGQDVTADVLAEAQRGAQGRSTVEGFKAEVRAAAPLTFRAVVELAVAAVPAVARERAPGARRAIRLGAAAPGERDAARSRRRD